MIARLVILGVLRYAGRPMHGYEIKKKLEEWAIGEYAQFSYGSIYYNLERMEKEGLVESKVVKNSRRPERKLYSLTDRGEEELIRLLRKNYFEVERIYYPFDVGVSLMPLLPWEEVLEALKVRIRIAKEHIEGLRREKAEFQGKIPFFALAIFDHYIYHFEAEKKWLEELKREVEKRKDYFEDLQTGREGW